MKYILLLSLLILTSCGSGYEIEGPYESRVGASTSIYYTCTHSRPIFFFNIKLKQCSTVEECNTFCEEKRQADK